MIRALSLDCKRQLSDVLIEKKTLDVIKRRHQNRPMQTIRLFFFSSTTLTSVKKNTRNDL